MPPGSEGEAAAASPRRACTRQAARSRARPEAPRPVVSPAQPSSTDNHGRRHRGHGRRRPAARGPAEHDVRRRPAQAVESVVVRAAREGGQPARRHERFIKVVDGFDTSASEKSPAEATAEDLAFDPVWSAAAPTSQTGGRTATRTATTTTSSGERRPVDGGPVCFQTVRTSIKTEARHALVRHVTRRTKVHGRAGHALS